MNKPDRNPPGLFSTLFVVLGPILVIGAFTTLLAMLAALIGWHPAEMQITSAFAGTATALLALVLVYPHILARREASRAVRHVEARMGGLLDTAMDAIIAVDQEQRIVLYNKAAQNVFRWPQDAVLGQSLDMLIPERYRNGHGHHIKRFGETGVTSRRMGDRTVVVGVRANGEEFPIEASISKLVEGGHQLFTVILRDVTERVRAEELLASNEARLRGILDSAMDAIITVDEEQHIVLFNAAAEQVFGCPRVEAIGAPLAWFIPERFRAGHADHVARFGATGTSSRRMGAAQRVVTGLRRNGEEFPIEASISQIVEGGKRFYTVILRDVTERLKADEALRRSREELREFATVAQSLREREKTRVARELHDELGQALTALKMDVSWLAEHLSSDQEVMDKLTDMTSMLDDTVTATRRISSDLRPLMLDDLGLVPAIQWLAQSFMERSGVACDLEISLPDHDLPEPYATTVFRILQESLTNVARHAQASLVEVAVSQVNGCIQLSIHDDGRGFAPDDPRKPNSFGLTGLRERVYLLNGQLAIDSSSGQGTRIEVSIPNHAEAET